MKLDLNRIRELEDGLRKVVALGEARHGYTLTDDVECADCLKVLGDMVEKSYAISRCGDGFCVACHEDPAHADPDVCAFGYFPIDPLDFSQTAPPLPVNCPLRPGPVLVMMEENNDM